MFHCKIKITLDIFVLLFYIDAEVGKNWQNIDLEYKLTHIFNRIFVTLLGLSFFNFYIDVEVGKN